MSEEEQPRYISSLKELETSCPQCGMELSRPHDAKRHLDEVHGQRKSCFEGCKYTTNRRERLQKHLMKVHNMSKLDAKALANYTFQPPDESHPSQNQDLGASHDQYHNNTDQNVDNSPRRSDANPANSGHNQEDNTVAKQEGEMSYTDMLTDGMDGYKW